MTVDKDQEGQTWPAASGSNPAAAMFTVPREVKYLDADQLKALTDSIRAWRDKAAKANVRRSRDRIWLIFLLMRHTGARLGEILALDPQTDLDGQRSLVRLGGGDHDGEQAKAREVPVPPEVMREVMLHVNDPAMTGHGEPVFAMDLGYVRRKLYERAEAAELPRSLAGPNVIRNSRAVEMLRAGTPLALVQNLLGLESIGPAARFLEFSDQDLERMKHFYARKEMRHKTSARNTFLGVVRSVRQGPVMSEVELDVQQGRQVRALITTESLHALDMVKDSMALAQIKAPYVHLAKPSADLDSEAANTFAGRVSEIKDDGTVAEVVVSLDGESEICALLASSEASTLGLAEGQDVLASFKSLSVILQVE